MIKAGRWHPQILLWRDTLGVAEQVRRWGPPRPIPKRRVPQPRFKTKNRLSGGYQGRDVVCRTEQPQFLPAIKVRGWRIGWGRKMAVFFGGFAAGIACTLLAVARLLLLYPNERPQQDSVKLLTLITEINDLIAEKEER